MKVNTIADLYAEMLLRGLCGHAQDFSVRYLGLAPSYFRLRGEASSVSSLLTCWDRLLALGEFDLAAACFDLLRERNKTNARSDAMRGRPHIRASASRPAISPCEASPGR